MEVEEIPFPRTSGIWGQFINSDGVINEQMEYSFRHQVNAVNSIEELLECFDFKILFASAPIENFYRQFAIKI
jgi:hypothetical protein